MSLPGESANLKPDDAATLFAQGVRACPACGAEARREGARFCSTCGRAFGEEYFPTDSLRASYRFERAPQAPPPPKQRPAPAPARERARRPAPRARFRKEVMPARNQSGATATASAFVTYALVPYLGILFCPGALLFGGVGLLRAARAPHAGHARSALLSIALGLVILLAQVVLWWVLYKVPEWSRQMGNF